MLEDMGNAVKIMDRIIPAVNIQTIPGYYQVGDKLEWYGVYFEIMFEEGDLWVVIQGDEPTNQDTIQLEEYDRWGFGDQQISYGRHLINGTWGDFLQIYDDKLRYGRFLAQLEARRLSDVK